ncbi:MAG: YihY/virulence factor BrkB family protein [Bacteroidales bacterium]|nr:YihY/virulence factor BrkB family protein [Bacteroidales bacterium]
MNLKTKISRAKIFIVENILHTPERELSGLWRNLRKLVSVIRITAKHFLDDELQLRASALTYNTMLAIVPILAILIAVAGGFGFEKIIESQILESFPAQKDALSTAFQFVDNYLKFSQSGVVIGIGVVFLLWTVISLLSNIEMTMNKIWQAKERSLYHKINDYTSLFIILPILMILSSGTSVLITTFLKDAEETFGFITPLIYKLLELSPYFFTIIFFTVAYLLIPNTKVKFKYAFIAGIVCGIAFQLFQYLYLNGQIWVSKYNAIYGSFAFLPLLLLWMQLSWLIFLFGVLLSFSMQTADYGNEDNVKKISSQYYKFILLIISCVIVQRFEKGLPPLTLQNISSSYNIPIRIAKTIINKLIDSGIIIETLNEDERVPSYQPAFDISNMSVGMLLSRVDADGTGEKNFRINRDQKYKLQWETITKAYNTMYNAMDNILIKDVEIEQINK